MTSRKSARGGPPGLARGRVAEDPLWLLVSSSARSRSTSSSRVGSDGGSRSKSGSRSQSAASSAASAEASDEESSDTVSLTKLMSVIKRDLDLHKDSFSKLDQTKILAMARAEFNGVKGLAQAHVPNAKVVKTSGHHLLGCPCRFCRILEEDLEDRDKEVISRVRAIRDWMPEGENRPLCLQLPAAFEVNGEQPKPFMFFDEEGILIQLEKKFSSKRVIWMVIRLVLLDSFFFQKAQQNI